MRDLKEIGFSGIKRINLIDRSFFDDAFPPEYLDFLDYVFPDDLELGFKFLEKETNEEWEGQVVEFMEYDGSNILDGIVSMPSDGDSKLLPIATDAGGNYLYIMLSDKGRSVVDVSYNSGLVSQVAENFSAFLDKLYIIEE